MTRVSLLETQGEAQADARRSSCVRVLLVDDGSAERETVVKALAGDRRVALAEAESPAQVEALVAGGAIDVVVSELAPWGDGELQILDRLAKGGARVPVVIVTSRGSEFWAAEAIKRGAADYLSKASPYLEDLSGRVIAAAAKVATVVNGRSPSWRGDTAAYTRILNALPVHIALLDERGTIRAVNDMWRMAAFETHYQSARHDAGVNYLAVCDAAVELELNEAPAIAEALRSVLAGQWMPRAVEYTCPCEGTQRWFKFAVSPLRDEEHSGAILVHVDITDRKQAELERDQLFEQSWGLLCIGNFDGSMRRWSASANRLGYSNEELLSVPLWEFVHPDDVHIAARMGAQLRAGKSVSTVEMRARAKDGSYRWILWDAVPCLEQNAFIATGQDITDRKAMEQQLRESHQRFQLIASATQEAVWDWDLRENRLWQNDAYLQIFGTFDQTRQTPIEWWRHRIHRDDRERILASIPRSAVDGQQKWALEYRLARADGSFAHVYDRGFVIFDEGGEPVRMVGAIIDITELKTAEARLRESEERFRLAARATRDAIWDWDRQSDQVWRSNGFQTLFGYPPEEVEPNFAWWVERIHPDDRERVLAQIPPDHVDGSQQCTFEYRFRRADDSYADVFDRSFVMRGPDGRPVRMVGTIMDISERRRAEEMAHMHQAELAHMARVSTMGEIATGIAHELNQPLTAISNYAESCAQALSLKSPDGEEKVRRWIDRIMTNTHRAAEMIRRLRSFTRKSEPRRSTVEVGELVDEVLDLVEAETRAQNVRVRWRRNGEVFATVDRIQVQQVLVNLLRNAYEAMAANHPGKRRVTLAMRAAGSKVELSVEDSGEGIPPDNLHRVFDAFFTSKPNGVGIGLAISRSIVEDHGGRLWVQPNPRRGVTFHFTLPLSGA